MSVSNHSSIRVAVVVLPGLGPWLLTVPARRRLGLGTWSSGSGATRTSRCSRLAHMHRKNARTLLMPVVDSRVGCALSVLNMMVSNKVVKVFARGPLPKRLMFEPRMITTMCVSCLAFMSRQKNRTLQMVHQRLPLDSWSEIAHWFEPVLSGNIQCTFEEKNGILMELV